VLFNDPVFIFDQPEQEENPFLTLQQLFLTKTNRGVGTKNILVSRMLNYGFTIEQGCPASRLCFGALFSN
jgi:hypothetical protein